MFLRGEKKTNDKTGNETGDKTGEETGDKTGKETVDTKIATAAVRCEQSDQQFPCSVVNLELPG